MKMILSSNFPFLILFFSISKKLKLSLFFIHLEWQRCLDGWCITKLLWQYIFYKSFCITKLNILCNLHKFHRLNTLKYQDLVLYWKKNYFKTSSFSGSVFRSLLFTIVQKPCQTGKVLHTGKKGGLQTFYFPHYYFIRKYCFIIAFISSLSKATVTFIYILMVYILVYALIFK